MMQLHFWYARDAGFFLKWTVAKVKLKIIVASVILQLSQMV